MNIRFNGKYLSLSSFEWENVPDFAVITGPNGAGKTQLLDLIARSYKNPRQPPKVVIGDLNLESDQVFHLTSQWFLRESATVTAGNIQRASKSLYDRFKQFQENKLRQDQEDYQIFVDLVNRLDKSKEDITEDEFYENLKLPPVVVREQQDLNARLSEIFYDYRLRWSESTLRHISDEEFLKNQGPPPWETLSEIIKESGLPFEFNYPDLSLRKPYTLQIKNSITEEQIEFPQLSSGEQVIISMVFWLYHAKKNSVFPRLLLLDEPDAHLHPAMTKQFIDTVYNVLVCNHDVKVIMTTHAPSTVALSPHNSLFLINNKPNVTIEPISKDKALRILTAGVPTLSIDYENRRQVFVENKTDVLFYEKIYEKLRNKLVPEISINFIPSGVEGQGGCSQVKHIVNRLRQNGNQSIYGIIDWDEKNNGNEYIKVPGKDKRYTLENYVFDPILLAAFLFRERFIKRKDLGLREDETYIDFRSFNDTELQKIVDYIIAKVETKIGRPPNNAKLLVEYIGGQKVEIPSWFLLNQGHELEDTLKNTFVQLDRYQQKGELKKEIINKVIDDIPEFIPIELFTTLREIQN